MKKRRLAHFFKNQQETATLHICNQSEWAIIKEKMNYIREHSS